MAYREIEDIKRIRQLYKILEKSIRKSALKGSHRRIGFPGGHEERDVFFLEDNGSDSLWYASWYLPDQDKQVTLLGHGQMGSNDWLPIDVQFNLPLESFHRRMGAAFLEDAVTGEEYLAHRGIVTLRQRVPKDKVLEAMAGDVVEAETSKRSDEFLLVALLESDTLIEDLGNFSRRLRNTIRNMDHAVEDTNPLGDVGADESNSKVLKGSTANAPPPDTLQAYFMEFSGSRRSFTPKKTFPVSYHGKVVHALHEEMSKRGTTLKSRAIDLVADLQNEAILFEIKTKADTQNVYCAIGQLTVHQPAVARFLKKSVRKILVVPEFPMALLKKSVEEDLNITIITYTLSSRKKVKFTGLEDL
ncbi:hypothetical protein [Massilia sp. TWR1-2-2]|uniref:hypothetical protein n=1 Tax=Massilia sp. TWR1-2-2 TaxID=2804584 RepID=UPI003CFA9478